MENVSNEKVSYCKNHIDLDYCSYVNMKVPTSFCLCCRGDSERYKREDIREVRKNFLPLTTEQWGDWDLVSVIIPCVEADVEYLARTIESIRKTAVGLIELIIVCDGFGVLPFALPFDNIQMLSFDEQQGQRAAMNEAAKVANGKYLFRVDAHVAMSSGWDARMKSSCAEETIVATVFDHLTEETWEGQGRDSLYGFLDSKLNFYFVRSRDKPSERKSEEEIMAMSGGSWMIRKGYYFALGGSDESLGVFGSIGAEWSLKAWLTGGRIVVRTDVVCCHLFRIKTPFLVDAVVKEKALRKLYRQWVIGEDPRRTRPMEWLLYKFDRYVKARPRIRFSDAVI